jgi:hypothetical protein
MRVDSSCGRLTSYQPTSCRRIDLRYSFYHSVIWRCLAYSSAAEPAASAAAVPVPK